MDLALRQPHGSHRGAAGRQRHALAALHSGVVVQGLRRVGGGFPSARPGQKRRCAGKTKSSPTAFPRPPLAPFGVLPRADSDKPLIHAAAYKGIQRTAPTGASNVIRSKTTLALAEDGSASGELRLETQDITAINMRALTSVIAPANTGDFVAQNLAKNGIAGSGTMAWSDDLETGRHSITVSYKTSN